MPQLAEVTDHSVSDPPTHHVHIPPDVLLCIFEFLADTPPKIERPRLISPVLSVSQVCRTWREVAIGRTGLWRTLVVDTSMSEPVLYSQLWLERSGQRGIGVYVSCRSEGSQISDDLFQVLGRHSHRVTSLDITALEGPPSMHGIRTLQNLENLESLTLRLSAEAAMLALGLRNPIDPNTSPLPPKPLLRSLSLFNYTPISNSCLELFHELQSLVMSEDYHPDWAQHAYSVGTGEILSNCFKLQELTLIGSFGFPISYYVGGHRVFTHLQFLTTLTLCHGDCNVPWLSTFDAPNLHYLQLSAYGWGGALQSEPAAKHVLQFLQRCRPPIRTFVLRGTCLWAKEVVGVLKKMEELQSITFDNAGTDLVTLFDKLVTSTDARWVCPNLVDIRLLHGSTLHRIALESLVKARPAISPRYS